MGIERRRVVEVTRHDMGLQCFMERKDREEANVKRRRGEKSEQCLGLFMDEGVIRS